MYYRTYDSFYSWLKSARTFVPVLYLQLPCFFFAKKSKPVSQQPHKITKSTKSSLNWQNSCRVVVLNLKLHLPAYVRFTCCITIIITYMNWGSLCGYYMHRCSRFGNHFLAIKNVQMTTKKRETTNKNRSCTCGRSSKRGENADRYC